MQGQLSPDLVELRQPEGVIQAPSEVLRVAGRPLPRKPCPVASKYWEDDDEDGGGKAIDARSQLRAIDGRRRYESKAYRDKRCEMLWIVLFLDLQISSPHTCGGQV